MKRASAILESARLDREIDFEEICKKTKIPLRYLIAFENENTKEKFFICSAESNCFFKEDFNQAIGEKKAYAYAIEKAKPIVFNLVYFCHFATQGVFKCLLDLKQIPEKSEQFHQGALKSMT
jgi:hypothetical protein